MFLWVSLPLILLGLLSLSVSVPLSLIVVNALVSTRLDIFRANSYKFTVISIIYTGDNYYYRLILFPDIVDVYVRKVFKVKIILLIVPEGLYVVLEDIHSVLKE